MINFTVTVFTVEGLALQWFLNGGLRALRVLEGLLGFPEPLDRRSSRTIELNFFFVDANCPTKLNRVSHACRASMVDYSAFQSFEVNLQAFSFLDSPFCRRSSPTPPSILADGVPYHFRQLGP